MKPVKKTFKRMRVIVSGMYDQYDADLADYIGYSNANDGYIYLLFVTYVFNRYLWIEPIKNKADRSIVETFRAIFARGRKPRHFRTDRGKEFTGNILEDYFKSIDVEHFVSYNKGKLCRELL